MFSTMQAGLGKFRRADSDMECPAGIYAEKSPLAAAKKTFFFLTFGTFNTEKHGRSEIRSAGNCGASG